jgi:5'(3')-deoxyribonucleotidase
MKKEILIIDFDEVIIEKFFLYRFNEFTGKNLTENDFTKVYMQDELEPVEREKFFEYLFSRKNVYENVPLMPDAKETLEKLNQKYELYLCSDFLLKGYERQSSKLLMDKCEIYNKELPFIEPTQYIFMRNKPLIKADILIDDRLTNFSKNVKTKLLYTAYHNKNMSKAELDKLGLVRVSSWKEISAILL